MLISCPVNGSMLPTKLGVMAITILTGKVKQRLIWEKSVIPVGYNVSSMH
jgi:hypothetical protein